MSEPDCDLGRDVDGSECVSKCHASRDGECIWRGCPQRKNWKSHCPLDKVCRIHPPDVASGGSRR